MTEKQMNNICLKDCVWDKERATLTWDPKDDPRDEAIVTSHVTGKAYSFRYKSDDILSTRLKVKINETHKPCHTLRMHLGQGKSNPYSQW